MRTEKYQPDKHNDMLLVWYKQWGIPSDYIEMLPATGLVIEGVCALFIYETNSKMCFIEPFICNKKADKETREMGLDLVCQEVHQWAKDLGYKKMMIYSNHYKVINRAITKHNFTLSKNIFNVLYRSL